MIINSIPAGAEFSIKDENNKSVHHGTTPATVNLERGDGYFDGQTYDVDFKAEGYLPQTTKVNTSINGWYFGNFIFGGLLGMFIIDPATGAMWSLPKEVNINLSQVPKIIKPSIESSPNRDVSPPTQESESLPSQTQ